MLTQVDVVYEDEHGPKALALPIRGLTTKDSLLLRKITGLGPPDPTLFIGEYARDGGTYQGRRVGKRNVVITIDLNPNPALEETVQGLREFLYKLFMDPLVDAEHVQLVLHDDLNNERYLYGYAEKFDSDIFEAENLVMVSIICPDPYIRDIESVTLEHAGGGWATVPFSYKGSAEAGFEVEINITSPTSILTLDNNGRTMIFDDFDFEIGDVVNINTNRGSRDATITREGITMPLIAALTPASRWLELHSANNTLRVYGETPTDIHAAIKSLEYTATYWGV